MTRVLQQICSYLGGSFRYEEKEFADTKLNTVLEFLDLMEAASIDIYLDGGWNIVAGMGFEVEPIPPASRS